MQKDESQISRQARWQRKHRAMGLCVLCSRPAYKGWRFVSWFNEHHSLWAWVSLFWVGFADFYVHMCSMGYWHDPRFF